MTTFIHDVIGTSIEQIKLKAKKGEAPLFVTKIQVKWKSGEEIIRSEINLMSDKRVTIEEII